MGNLEVILMSFRNHILSLSASKVRIKLKPCWLPCHKFVVVRGDEELYESFFFYKIDLFVRGYIKGIEDGE